jgi:hypothetical protein
MLDAAKWSTQQWGAVALGDQRLNRRAVEIGALMAAHPAASLPEQMKSPAVLKAAYALLNHPGVSLADLTAPTRTQTLQAAGEREVTLWVEDTTELDYSAHPSMTGLGPIGDGRGRGLLLHSTLAVTPDSRQVLGLAYAQVVLRQAQTGDKRTRYPRSAEALVWEASVEAVGAAPAGRVWVHVSDSGSDSFEYLAACRRHGKHFLVRAYHDRKLPAEGEQATAAETLLGYARSLPAQPDSAYVVTVPAVGQQPARQATLALTWARVTLPPPHKLPAAVRRTYQPLTVWLVRAWEPHAPPDCTPVEWLLLSSLPVVSLADAQLRVAWYTCRWLCEDYHQCLKTGCQIERRQLDDGADIQRLLGFLSPIAVRLLQLRQSVRQAPDQPALSVVEPLLVRLVGRLAGLPAQELTVAEFWRQVARLGGHQGRRGDGAPGWRTLWRGWQYLADLAEGARLVADRDAP